MKSNIKMYYFLISIVGGTFATAMPLYYEGLQYNNIQIGILMAMTSLVMFTQPLFGFIVDRFQKPKFLAITSILSSALILLLLLFVTEFKLVLLVIFLFALLKTPVWSTVDNIIITYCMNHNINYGPLRVFASIAWGSSLLIMYPFIAIFGFNAFFIINFIFSILLAILIHKMPSDTKLIKENESEITFGEGIVSLLRNKKFYFIVLFTFFFSSMFVTNLNYQALYFDELGKSNLFIALAMFLSIVPEFIILPNIEKFLKNKEHVKILIFVAFLYAVKFFVTAVFLNVYILLLVTTMHGIAMSLYIPTHIKMLKESVPSNVSTVAITINAFMAALSGTSMSLVAGVVAQSYGFKYVFFLNVIMMFLAMGTLFIFLKFVKTDE